MITILKVKLRQLIQDEKFKEILQGSIYSFGAKIIASLIGIITSIIGARYYGAEMLGMVAILGTILSLASLFSVMGMSTSLLKLIPEYKSKHSLNESIAIYKQTLYLVFLFSLIVGVVLYLLSDVLANHIFHNNELTYFISLAAIVLVFQSINSINIVLVRALKKIKLYAFFELLPKLIYLILLLILTFYYYNKYNLIYISFSVIIILTIIISFYLLLHLKKYSDSISRKKLPTNKYILWLSFPMFLTGGLQVIIGQSDIVMIGLFRETSELGVYSIVFSLAMITNFILSSINVMAAPKFSELFHAKKIDELKYVVQKSSKLMFWAMLPVLTVLMVFGKLILNIYGESFILGYTALILLIIGQVINSISGSNGVLMNMCGYQNELRNIILVSAIINLILNYLLIPKYGIDGAAIASMISVLYWNTTSLIFIKKKFGFNTFYVPFIIIK